jgi:hypothetical protein
MTLVLAASAGLVLGGPRLAVCLVAAEMFRARRKRRPRPQPIRPVLLVMIVELRAGRSTLAALQAAATAFPDHPQLVMASRVAAVRGLGAAVEHSQGPTRMMLAQLARAQRSGSPVADVVRSLLDSDIAAERARRMEKARSLPVRLMIPIALLVLPGLVLLTYAPSLLRTLTDLSAPFS